MRYFAAILLPILSLPSALSAAPAPSNSLQQILERTCLEGVCAEGYKVHFKQISYEPHRLEATLDITLQPLQGIDYPIFTEAFEAQLVQNTFAVICKIRHVASVEGIAAGDGVNSEFETSLKSCLSTLTERTEKALGRSH